MNILLFSLPTTLVLFFIVTFSSFTFATQNTQPVRHRLLVLTDIEADPDDTQSLVRLLLYANQIDITGLVATTSVHQKTMVAPESIHKVLDAYDKVRHNLNKHEKGYPKTKTLRARVKQGLPVYGMAGVGADKDSEGSNWIINTLKQNDDRPLWISVWGGVNTLAQALYRLKETHDEQTLRKLTSKLRVYTISDQDDSGSWIRKNFPELFYILSPGGYGAATWTAISSYVEGIDNTTVSNAWLTHNIQQSHGPLGAQYPDVAYGMEGDTPSWLNLIPNGLNTPEHPNWGGWGGRYELYIPQKEATDPNGFTGGVPVVQETRPIWSNTKDHYVPIVNADYGRTLKPGGKSFNNIYVTLWRWRDEFQNDFAARMDWTVLAVNKANHAPVPRLKHAKDITVKSGGTFHLDARDSVDPDGDSLVYWWFNYPEAGTMPDKEIKIHSAENMARVHIVAPQVSKRQQLHFILKVTDRGTPPLTRYKRVLVTVTP